MHKHRDTIPDVPSAEMPPKRKRPHPVTFYCTEEQLRALGAAVETSGLNRQDYVANTVFARVEGGLAVAPEIAKLVRAEAKRLKVPAEHALTMLILAATKGKDGD
jgi:hypothetical protein